MRRTVRDELKGTVPDELLSSVPSSFDIIGSKAKAVAIIEIPSSLEYYESDIAGALMKVHRNVSSVLAKDSGRKGDFRVRELRLVLGDPETEVVHKESGCLFRLDPRQTYFSTRESTERERITRKVGRDESILVMFSGVGPFPILITRKHQDARATAIELNPVAHNYCVENSHLNKVDDRVTPIQGDVRDICPSLDQTFDRVLMPLPRGAHQFLDVAIPMVDDEGVLHFYHWAPDKDPFSEAEGLVQSAVAELGRSAEIIDRAKISQYSPRVSKIRVDARITS